MAVNWRKLTRLAAGTALVLLGLLWTLQGADLVSIRPILCAGECKPVTGGSIAWLVAGAITTIIGLAVTGVLRLRAVRRGSPSRRGLASWW